MSFIDTIAPEEATAAVADLYQRQQGRLEYLPNYARVFCHRPEVMTAWAGLQRTLQEHLDSRQYSLIALASALAIGSSYCSLAHASKLLARCYTEAQMAAIIRGDRHNSLSAAERAMMALAHKVAINSSSVTRADIGECRNAGFSDAQVFDIVAAAAARCFFAKIPDALGVQADAELGASAGSLAGLLTVGRPVAETVSRDAMQRDGFGNETSRENVALRVSTARGHRPSRAGRARPSLYAEVWRVLHYSLTDGVKAVWRRRITRKRHFMISCARVRWRV